MLLKRKIGDSLKRITIPIPNQCSLPKCGCILCNTIVNFRCIKYYVKVLRYSKLIQVELGLYCKLGGKYYYDQCC